MEIVASLRGNVLPGISVELGDTVAEVLRKLTRTALVSLGKNPDEPVQELKCVGGKGIRVDQLDASQLFCDAVGKHEGTLKYKLFLTTKQDAEEVSLVDAEVAKVQETQRKLRRERRKHKESHKQYTPPSSEYGFQRIQVLPGLPDQKRAEFILRVLAEDPGVVGCMKEKGYVVGSLEELMPDGKVGVDDVCVMGLNVNKGMAIKLRIRTDDLQGWRPLSVVKKVLYHELAHNEISEHTREFFNLTANIRDCCEKHDYRLHGGLHDLAGNQVRKQWQTVVEGGDRPGLWKIDDYDEPEFDEHGIVGGLRISKPVSPREAALQAARLRQQQAQEEQQEAKDSVDSILPVVDGSVELSERNKKHRSLSKSDKHRSSSKSDEKHRSSSKSYEKHRSSSKSDKHRSLSKDERHKSASKGDRRGSGSSDKSTNSKSRNRNSKSSKEGIDSHATANQHGAMETEDSNESEQLPGKQGEVQQCANRLAKLDGGPAAATTLLKVVTNALSAIGETESKFFHIKTSPGTGLHKLVAQKYGERVFDASVEFLQASGFSEESVMDPTSSDGTKRSLRLIRKDPGLLWLAKSFLSDITPRS